MEIIMLILCIAIIIGAILTAIFVSVQTAIGIAVVGYFILIAIEGIITMISNDIKNGFN